MVNCNFQLFNSHFRCFPERPLLHEIPGAHPNLRHCHVISVIAQPISIRKPQSRKKSPQTFAHLVHFSNKCVGRLNVSIILSFWLLNKQTFHIFYLLHLYFVLCLNDLDVLRAQRIMGFSIIITINKAGKYDHGLVPHAASHTRLRCSLGQWRCLRCWPVHQGSTPLE